MQLSRIASLETTFGYITSHYRSDAGIEKSHVNDAVVIADKKVFTLKGFNRWDTVQYKGKIGFISGFTGGSFCYLVNIEGNYIKNSEKKYKQVSLRQVRKIHSNKSIISQYADSSPTES